MFHCHHVTCFQSGENSFVDLLKQIVPLFCLLHVPVFLMHAFMSPIRFSMWSINFRFHSKVVIK